jgi:hypothetical protein
MLRYCVTYLTALHKALSQGFVPLTWRESKNDNHMVVMVVVICPPMSRRAAGGNPLCLA